MESHRSAAFFPALKQRMPKTFIQLLLSMSHQGVLFHLSYTGSPVLKFCYPLSQKRVEKSPAKKEKNPPPPQTHHTKTNHLKVFKTGKPWLIMNDKSSLVYPKRSSISNLTAQQKVPVRAIDY